MKNPKNKNVSRKESIIHKRIALYIHMLSILSALAVALALTFLVY